MSAKEMLAVMVVVELYIVAELYEYSHCLIIWVVVEPQCCVLETNLRLYTNDTWIKKEYNHCFDNWIRQNKDALILNKSNIRL